jgi:predicted DNA-binding WGR domain protein
MKLIKQTILHFQEGSSDKVYEVDLCEVGPGRCVVNFRYGRRGGAMREGSETPSPLPQAEAERVYDKVVQGKIRKGYRDVTVTGVSGRAAPPQRPAPAPAPPPSSDARERAILARLQRLAERRAGAPKEWPAERAIFRAGALRLRAAVPYLVRLIGSGSALRDYCVAYALGRCADPSAEETDAIRDGLHRLAQSKPDRDMVRRMAIEALRLLSDEATRAEMAADLCGRLPGELAGLARSGPSEAFQAALQDFVARAGRDDAAVLETLYLIDSAHVRPGLLAALRTVKLEPPWFRPLRHIFKAAEYRQDGELFGLLAYRFEKTPPMFRKSGYDRYLVAGRRVRTGELKRMMRDGGTAFGEKTRHYLRWRVWRTLRTLGEERDPAYVPMAVGVLLPFSDTDAVAEKRREEGWGRRRQLKARWGPYAPYWALNHILYGRSARYEPQKNGKAWRIVKGRLNSPEEEPTGGEEAFPELWARRPEGLLHLLAESGCEIVHRFAAKALGRLSAFLAGLDTETVIMLLGRPYEVTARLGATLARERYRPEAPDAELALAVAQCAWPEGRRMAHRWIDEARGHFLALPDLVLALVTSPYADTRAFARQLLRTAPHEGPAAQALIGRILAHLLSLGAGHEDQARDIADTLLSSFPEALRALGTRPIADLLAHGLKEVRELGLRLLAQVTDEELRRAEGLLAVLVGHAVPELRSGARPLIARLSGDAAFGQRLALALSEALLKKEQHEGVHAHLLQVLREDLQRYFQALPLPRALALAAGPSKWAHDLGGLLLLGHPEWAEALRTEQIVRLASHEVLSVRQASWLLFERIVPRLHAHPEEMAEGVRLLDAKWEDSRDAAFRLFRTAFSGEQFTPGILIGICDSVYPDVQKFGRELITRHFNEPDGEEYLIKLSEHPSADLQLFATNYLERYAADRPERLAALAPYFLSVLSRVNRARVAKGRLYAFLATEAQKSEAAARTAAEILGRVSATISIRDRTRSIEGLVAIARRYPQIPLPLSIREAAVRSGAQHAV